MESKVNLTIIIICFNFKKWTEQYSPQYGPPKLVQAYNLGQYLHGQVHHQFISLMCPKLLPLTIHLKELILLKVKN